MCSEEDVEIVIGIHSHEKRIYEAVCLQFRGEKLSQMEEDQRRRVSKVVQGIVDVLNERNQPYNLLIRDHIVHIIPRQLETNVQACNLGFGPAMVELFGVFIIKSEELWA